MNRKNWIDAVKALCMIGVYLMHSYAYYNNNGTNYGAFVSPFYVNAFFFVSGYLLFGKLLVSDLEKWGGILNG